MHIAGVVQRLVCEFSKLEIAVRFCAPAPQIFCPDSSDG